MVITLSFDQMDLQLVEAAHGVAFCHRNVFESFISAISVEQKLKPARSIP